MQYYYGDSNLLRALDEAEFWKHQEIEHTVVVRIVTPGLEENYVNALISYQEAATKTHGYLVRYIESTVRSGEHISGEIKTEVKRLVAQCVHQSEKFVELLTEILRNSEAAKKNEASQTVIKHMIRESQYFIGIDQIFLK